MRSNAGQPGNREARLLQTMAGRARAGFTLMEIVVAVGAVALVAVGLASIFDTVGKTVTGGKRVSNLNTYAGLLEKQMRSDFEAMSRDGFLVIRNQWVDNIQNGPGDGLINDPIPRSDSPVGTADTVPVSPDATTARPRRIDEILFFVNGQFTSSRQPLSPGVQATSGVAEVYYGHGQRAVPLPNPDPQRPKYKNLFPRIDGRNNVPTARLGIPPAAGQPLDSNPNYYAGNWTLLRHLTLLVRPKTADDSPVPLGTTVFSINPNLPNWHPTFADGYTQISMQPAVSSIFRSLQAFPAAGPQTLRQLSDGSLYPPYLASGLVDIAATDLVEVRATAMSGRSFANANFTFPYQMGSGDMPIIPSRDFFPVMENVNNQYRNARPATYLDLDRIQAWMSDAFPTDSRNQLAAIAANDFPANAADTGNLGTRMRYEPESTDLLAAMSFKRDGTPVGNVSTLPVAEQAQLASDRADQLMLSRTGLVPHCSEFIVEWSFGRTDPSGQIIWHGLNRRTDTNGDGVVDSNDALVAHPSPWGPNDQYAEFSYQTGQVINDSTGAVTDLLPATNPGREGHHITDRLIYGFSPTTTGSEACLTSYFGWTDPTFDASVPQGSHYEGPSTLPWAWPRLVRVTVTLSDPQEPAIESTFQYIFSTPEPKH